MSMQFNGSVHADGWWDHMPDGHKRDVRLNPYASQYETPAERSQRRSHTALWVVAAVIVVGAAGIGAAYQRDPEAVTAQYDAAVDGAHRMGERIADFFDNGKPAVGVKMADIGRPQDSDRLAMNEAPGAGVVPATKPAVTPEVTTPPAQEAPPRAAPATVRTPEVAHATPSTVTTARLSEPTTQAITPITPVAPVTPVSPVTTTPPVTTPPVIPPAVDATTVVPPSNAASAPPPDTSTTQQQEQTQTQEQ